MAALKKRGPRPKSERVSREAIKRAAKESLAHAGSRPPTLRGIAERAGVDQALISYYFGSKDNLLYEMGAEGLKGFLDLESLGEPGSRKFGVEAIRTFLVRCDSRSGGMSFEALFHAAIVGSHFRPFLARLWSEDAPSRLAGPGGGKDRRLATELFLAQIIGLGVARYILKLEPLASASIERVAASYGPALSSVFAVPRTRSTP